MFVTLEKVRALLSTGKTLILAGEEAVLRQVPKGNWIGGTIPYFMTSEGGKTSREGVFVEEVPAVASGSAIAVYDEKSIETIGVDSPDNGYTVLIVPAFTSLHQRYALEAPLFKDLFFKVVAGWISGIHLDDLGKKVPMVFDGRTGEAIESRAVALHVSLPSHHRAEIGIVNIFEPGDGPRIEFPASGFEAGECLVDGSPRNFVQYFAAQKLDSRLPLIADFNGALVNVSIQNLDPAAGKVKFYAPVFEGVTYRLAKAVANYPDRFGTAIPADVKNPAFTCNCVLNYLYGSLEGRRTGGMLGPMTFGEIAYQLLNQTLVHVTLHEVV